MSSPFSRSYFKNPLTYIGWSMVLIYILMNHVFYEGLLSLLGNNPFQYLRIIWGILVLLFIFSAMITSYFKSKNESNEMVNSVA